MKLFFDTSALIKRYITEIGSKKVDELFDTADDIIISSLTEIEAFSTIKRLLNEKAISEESYEMLKSNIKYDFKYFTVISLNKKIQGKAIELIEKHKLKSLDSIQLASCLYRRSDIRRFIVSDLKLKKAAIAEGLEIIDPTEFD